jgi:hypothetical protein
VVELIYVLKFNMQYSYINMNNSEKHRKYRASRLGVGCWWDNRPQSAIIIHVACGGAETTLTGAEPAIWQGLAAAIP